MRRDRQWMLAFAAALISALAACGQKGPLRLPEAPPAEAAPAVPADTTEAEAETAANDPTALEARRRNPHE